MLGSLVEGKKDVAHNVIYASDEKEENRTAEEGERDDRRRDRDGGVRRPGHPEESAEDMEECVSGMGKYQRQRNEVERTLPGQEQQ